MFEQIILSPPKGRTRRAMMLALVGQLALVAVLIAIPLLSVEQLLLADLNTVLIAPPPPPASVVLRVWCRVRSIPARFTNRHWFRRR
jgi:hypothetical protein